MDRTNTTLVEKNAYFPWRGNGRAGGRSGGDRGQGLIMPVLIKSAFSKGSTDGQAFKGWHRVAKDSTVGQGLDRLPRAPQMVKDSTDGQGLNGWLRNPMVKKSSDSWASRFSVYDNRKFV